MHVIVVLTSLQLMISPEHHIGVTVKVALDRQDAYVSGGHHIGITVKVALDRQDAYVSGPLLHNSSIDDINFYNTRFFFKTRPP